MKLGFWKNKDRGTYKTDKTGHTTTSGYKRKKPKKSPFQSKATHSERLKNWMSDKAQFYREVAKRNKKRQMELNEQAKTDREMGKIKKEIAARKKDKKKKNG